MQDKLLKIAQKLTWKISIVAIFRQIWSHCGQGEEEESRKPQIFVKEKFYCKQFGKFHFICNQSLSKKYLFVEKRG